MHEPATKCQVQHLLQTNYSKHTLYFNINIHALYFDITY